MGPLQISLPPSPTAPGLSRQALTSWLEGLGADGSIIADAAIVVSELVTNGVLHAPDNDIDLHAWTDDGKITIDVATYPSPLGSRNKATLNDPDEHGRGLPIVEALVDEITISDDHTRHHVRCRLSIVDHRL